MQTHLSDEGVQRDRCSFGVREQLQHRTAALALQQELSNRGRQLIAADLRARATLPSETTQA